VNTVFANGPLQVSLLMEVGKDRVAGKGLCKLLRLICFCARCSLYEEVFDPEVDDRANKPH